MLEPRGDGDSEKLKNGEFFCSLTPLEYKKLGKKIGT